MEPVITYLLPWTQSLSFESALQKAQELGFAEADPSFDIDGIDVPQVNNSFVLAFMCP